VEFGKNNPKKSVKWAFKNFVRAGASVIMYDFFLYQSKEKNITGLLFYALVSGFERTWIPLRIYIANKVSVTSRELSANSVITITSAYNWCLSFVILTPSVESDDGIERIVSTSKSTLQPL